MVSTTMFVLLQVSAKEGEDYTFTVEQPLENWIVKTVADNGQLLVYKLSGLSQKTFYQVSVKARNSIGWSGDHDNFVFRTAIG